MVDMFKPDYVAPVVGYLTSEGPSAYTIDDGQVTNSFSGL